MTTDVKHEDANNNPTVEIKLLGQYSYDKPAIIDEIDKDLLEHEWTRTKIGQIYTIIDKKPTLLTRIIGRRAKLYVTDHHFILYKDGNKYNNCRSNLYSEHK